MARERRDDRPWDSARAHDFKAVDVATATAERRIDGRPRAVYRDIRGDLHVLSPRCTHLGWLVAWNDLEKTWDCPCHGGRFHPTGKPLYGPPTSSLEHESDGDPAAD